MVLRCRKDGDLSHSGEISRSCRGLKLDEDVVNQY